MKPLYKFTALAPVAAAFAIAATPPAEAHIDNLADLVERIAPSTVSIKTTIDRSAMAQHDRGAPNMPEGVPEDFEEFFEEFFGRPPPGMAPGTPQSAGSGFVVHPDGYIVTNNHVIENGASYSVAFPDGVEYEAVLVGHDYKTDLAVLKIEVPEGVELTVAAFGDSSALRVGDPVVAIGNPFGLGNTVTEGILSAKERVISGDSLVDFFQISAAINRGNSGGATFNKDGQVACVNTAIFSPTGGNVGIGFCIPSNVAGKIAFDLIEHGEVQRGWLGVRIQSLTDAIASAAGMDHTNGAMIVSVTPDSPAASGELQEGDVIVRLNGEDIDSTRDLQQTVGGMLAEDVIEVVIIRGGQEITKTVTLGLMPQQPEKAFRAPPGAGPEEGQRVPEVPVPGRP